MAIVRWEPFRDLVSTQNQFNRLFNDTFGRFLGEADLSTRSWAPAADLYETDDSVVIKAELPGVDLKDVECHIEDGTLYLKGQRKFENDVKKENYHRVERCYGSFARSFSLPTSVDEENVVAEYKDGLLTLTMPKKEAAKPKTIKIKVAGEASKAAGAGAQK